MNILQINKLKRSTVFCEDFNDLRTNNLIDFGERNIVAIYAPNGVGKTSIAKVLSNEIDTEFVGNYNGNTNLCGENGIFHVIMDQNSRNVIEGKTEDFIMADDIRRERELKAAIDYEFYELKKILISTLKDDFGISKKTSKLLSYISNETIKQYSIDLSNSQSKGKNINIEEFLPYISSLELEDQNADNDKIKFIINNTDGDNSIIDLLKGLLEHEMCHNENISEIEENNDAIALLRKYIHRDLCIVCDNQINPAILLESKTLNKEAIIDTLDGNTKLLIKNIIEKLSDFDPFNIKEIILESISTGNIEIVQALINDINNCIQAYSDRICNFFINMYNETQLNEKWNEYLQLLNQQLEINEEDMQFIECFLNDSLDKKITLERDVNSSEIKLLLDDEDFLGRDRLQLHLSTGEQNFISLMFELIKAKNLNKDIIVIDDPISSFDSIFKNKIAFALIKFLENKKQLILTHNTDLLRLLEVQKQGCYNLYIFNNISEEENGFIAVGIIEQKMIIYTNELLNYLRSDCSPDIIDKKLFLVSLIPFMRGYSQFIGNVDIKNELTKVMHGYGTEQTNISEVYSSLFGTELTFENTCQISLSDILAIDLNQLNILNTTRYPLLNRVLKHTLTYLYLRLSVEKTLVEKYNVNTNRFDLLGDIIMNALRGDANQNRRIFFMSKKTLLNEFNHFEGNMNISQPAIDISDTNLQRERDSILDELERIRIE